MESYVQFSMGSELMLPGDGLVNGVGEDKWAALEQKYVARAHRAEEQLQRSQERERSLRLQLDANRNSGVSLHTKLDLNLTTLDQRVAEMKETLLERDRAITRADRMVARLEQQNTALKKQLEHANEQLDERAEVERDLRLKLKSALERVKNVDEDKEALCTALGMSTQEEREMLLKEKHEIEARMVSEREMLEERVAKEKEEMDKIVQKLQEELQGVMDTAAFSGIHSQNSAPL